MSLIYILVDPRNMMVRYIGKTIKTLNVRWKEHCLESRSSKETAKILWIKELAFLAMQPIPFVLEIVENHSLSDREIFWISRFRKMNCPLTNETDGGDGGTYRPADDVTRQKWITALRNARLSWWKRASNDQKNAMKEKLSAEWKTMTSEQLANRKLAISSGLAKSELFKAANGKRKGKKPSDSAITNIKRAANDPVNRALQSAKKIEWWAQQTEEMRRRPKSTTDRVAMRDAALRREERRRARSDYLPPKKLRKKKSRLDE